LEWAAQGRAIKHRSGSTANGSQNGNYDKKYGSGQSLKWNWYTELCSQRNKKEKRKKK